MPSKGDRHQRGYGNEWYRLSAKARKAQPWCTYCGSTIDLTADHIIPLKRGGASSYANMQVLCRRCNSRKQDGRGGWGTTEASVEVPRARFSRNTLT